MVTVRKNVLIQSVSRDTGIRVEVVRSVMDSLFVNSMYYLSRGNRVDFGDFGRFELQCRAPRTGRNPHTGEAVPIPARKLPKFTPGKLCLQSITGTNGKAAKK